MAKLENNFDWMLNTIVLYEFDSHTQKWDELVNTKENHPMVYFVAIFIDGEWYMKIGYTTNFRDRIKSLNEEYKIHMDNFYDDKNKIPKIIPLLLCYSEQEGIGRTIERKIKKVITPSIYKKKEVFDFSADNYDTIFDIMNSFDSVDIWESKLYMVSDDDSFWYKEGRKRIVIKE